MADYRHDQGEPFVAASAVGAFVPVFQNIASSRDEYVVPAATTTQFAIGLTIATVPTYGIPVQVVMRGRAKALAGASIGAGAQVGIASTNGALGPVLPSGPLGSLGPSAGVTPVRYILGIAPKAAAAGDVFTVILDPRQIV